MQGIQADVMNKNPGHGRMFANPHNSAEDIFANERRQTVVPCPINLFDEMS